MPANASNPKDGPVTFSKVTFGHDTWPMQQQILESVAVNRKTAVKSCHSSGKTFLAADAALWWVTRYKDGIVVTTAPGWNQVEKLLWGEIRKNLLNSRIIYPKANLTELKLAEGNYAIGISTNESTRFSGFHAARVLIILDEAPGVGPAIWEAIQGLRAGGTVHVLAIGNPTIIGGEFNDAFTTKRHTWNTFTISAFDTPNLAGCFLKYLDEQGKVIVVGDAGGQDLLTLSEDELDVSVRPYLCTRRWVKEMYADWGPCHPYFQSRVLGDFPTSSDDQLIPLSWLERYKYLPAPKTFKGRARAGLDVAGPGEAETVLTIVQDNHLRLLKAWPQSDPRGEVLHELMPYKDVLESFNIDSAGIGWGVYCYFKKDIFGEDVDSGGDGIVHPVNVGTSPRDKNKFVNAKAEFFWGLRMTIQDGAMTGIDDEALIGQLSAIKYRHNARNQIEIEGKKELAARGVKSPDRAESLMLAGASVEDDSQELFGLESIPRDESYGSVIDEEVSLERRSPWRNI